MNNETSNLPSSQELNNNRVDNSNIPVVKISNPDADEIYMLRSIPVEFGGDYNPKLIITQNNNGPCPLLALCNALILRNDIEIPQDRQVITFEGLSAILADFLLNNPKFSDPNFEQALSDVLAIIPTLQHGMDINLHFEYAKEFEFTGATTVFDICNIDLLHGWVCDPRDQDVYHVVAKELKSYNAVVEAIIAGDVALTSSEHTSDSDIAIAKGSVCKEFMDGTAGQLTNTGLEQLDKLLEPGLPSILFRNNHFLTIVKKNGRIWALVTDQGYMESEVVWESLDIGGDSEFVDGYFLPLNSQSIAPQYLNDESSEGFRFASTTTMSSREQREKGKKPKKQSECIIQ